MSKQYNKGPQYENHHQQVELQNLAAHVHDVAAESHGRQDHETPHEHTRRAQEHSQQAFLEGPPKRQKSAIGDDEVAALAYELWEARGRPLGSPDEDWFRAAEQLRSSR